MRRLLPISKFGHGGVEYIARVLGSDPTAGDPMRTEIKWTDLSRREISRRLGERGTPAGRGVVKQLLAKHGFVKRKARTGLKVTADMIDMRFRGTLDAQISSGARWGKWDICDFSRSTQGITDCGRLGLQTSIVPFCSILFHLGVQIHQSCRAWNYTTWN